MESNPLSKASAKIVVWIARVFMSGMLIGGAILAEWVSRNAFGLSLFNLKLYSQLQDALPLLCLSFFLFLAISSVLCLVLPYVPVEANDPIKNLVDERNDFIYGSGSDTYAGSPETALRSFFLLGIMLAAAIVASFFSWLLDRYFSPNLAYAFWVWDFWLTILIVAIVVSLRASIFGNNSFGVRFFRDHPRLLATLGTVLFLISLLLALKDLIQKLIN